MRLFSFIVKCLLIALTCVVSLNITFAIESKTEIASFKDSAVKKWQEMFNVADSYEIVVTTRRIENDKVIEESCSQGAVLFPCNYIEVDEENRQTIKCCNSQYGFALHRDKHASDWEINYVHKYNRELNRKRDWRMRHYASYYPLTDRMVKHYTDEELDRRLYSMVCNSSVWGQLNPLYFLPCLFTDSDFKITSITEIVNEDGFPCYNVEFNYKPGSEHNLLNVKEGRIELDRKNYAIRRAVYKWGRTDYNIQDVTMSYAEKDDVGFPLVTKRVLRDIENGKLRHIEEIEYDYRPVTNLTEDRFKLSYYGFPEPIFEDDAKFDVRWYFLIGGCFFIALAVLITRRRRSEPERQDADDVLAG